MNAGIATIKRNSNFSIMVVEYHFNSKTSPIILTAKTVESVKINHFEKS